MLARVVLRGLSGLLGFDELRGGFLGRGSELKGVVLVGGVSIAASFLVVCAVFASSGLRRLVLTGAMGRAGEA